MNTPTINPSKLARFADIRLDEGAHKEGAGMCAMEAAAWLTDEKWSDHPTCVSPVIGAFMRSLNDQWDDTRRQQLKPYTLRVIGTAGDGQDEARSYLALDWLLRTYTPAWLELAGLHEDAAALRDHRRVVDAEAARSIRPITEASRDHAAAARDSAWAAAGAAARDAARAAAGAAAGAAAWDAARAAAWDSAWDAARAAARDSARAAARDALAPTVDTLQASSLALLDRMVNPAGLP